jgi:hypothetical protein
METFFINSPDARYNDRDLAFVQDNLFTAGILGNKASGQKGFEVTPGSGLEVSVAPGRGFIEFTKNGITFNIGFVEVNNTDLAINTNSSGVTRTDTVVIAADPTIDLNLAKNNVTNLQVLQGNPGALDSSEIISELGHTNYVKVATVAVPNGASSISAGNITDVSTKVQNTRGFDFASDGLILFNNFFSVSNITGKLYQYLSELWFGDKKIATQDYVDDNSTRYRTGTVNYSDPESTTQNLTVNHGLGKLPKLINVATDGNGVRVNFNSGSDYIAGKFSYFVEDGRYNWAQSAYDGSSDSAPEHTTWDTSTIEATIRGKYETTKNIKFKIKNISTTSFTIEVVGDSYNGDGSPGTLIWEAQG